LGPAAGERKNRNEKVKTTAHLSLGRTVLEKPRDNTLERGGKGLDALAKAVKAFVKNKMATTGQNISAGPANRSWHSPSRKRKGKKGPKRPGENPSRAKKNGKKKRWTLSTKGKNYENLVGDGGQKKFVVRFRRQRGARAIRGKRKDLRGILYQNVHTVHVQKVSARRGFGEKSKAEALLGKELCSEKLTGGEGVATTESDDISEDALFIESRHQHHAGDAKVPEEK